MYYGNSNGITVKELIKFLENFNETDEVWLEDREELSSPVKGLWSLGRNGVLLTVDEPEEEIDD